MIQTSSSVSTISKIGPKYKELLKKLEIYSIHDLLYHFPFRYDDYSNVKNIKDILEGETATILAQIIDVKNIYTKYGKRLTKATVQDQTGQIDVMWFNQHYLSKVLLKGRTLYLSGKIGITSGKNTLISPEFEFKIGSDPLHTARLVPVYPETSGISSKWLRSRINDVLSLNLDLEEFIPDEVLNEENLKDIIYCLKQIHFPNDLISSQISRRRFKFEEFFLELLKVEKRKHEGTFKQNGIKFNYFENRVGPFVKSLPFELTDSQKVAVKEIFDDLQKNHPMNRLLEGDVGTGKTVVAVIASYLAFLNGYSTLYMAPTEILAKQHYETFCSLLNKTLCNNITCVTGSLRVRPRAGSDPCITIGTHALLYSQEKYLNVGLVVIDEQHRFGVEQRGKLLEMGRDKKIPHLLTMTATPIPRTLALTIYGDLNISILKTHPNKDRKITTKVIPDKLRQEAYQKIREKKEPTFIVCPLIDPSETESLENVKAANFEFEKLREGVFKGINMGLLHGRMKPKEKDEVISKFRKGEIQILVSTPVIEVGIDIPDATIMVIESAERYGLASLHQLRGRVGRGKKEGFCFVFMSSNSRDAYTRLKNLETIDSGLELAEIDLKIRGEGDVFGTIQHGFKKFKIASLSNVELLEKAKYWAQKIFPNIKKYPLLKSQLGPGVEVIN